MTYIVIRKAFEGNFDPFLSTGTGNTVSRLLAKRQISSMKFNLVKPNNNNLQSPVCSSNYTGQTSRRLVTRIKEHRSAIISCNVKASLMVSHCVDTGHSFDLAKTKILSHDSSWTARLFKEAWLSNKRQSSNGQRWPLEEESTQYIQEFFVKTYHLFWRRFAAPIWKLNILFTVKSPCSISHSNNPN